MTVIDPVPEHVLKREVEQDVMSAAGGERGVTPRRIDIERIEDFTGALAWRLLLVLPRPTEATWDTAWTRELKTAARESLDRHAIEHGLELEGVTSVAITTDDGAPEDTALPDEPEPDERIDSDLTDDDE